MTLLPTALTRLPAVLLTAMLCACATTQQPAEQAPAPEPQSATIRPGPPPTLDMPRASRGNPPFYEVMGERYYVLPDSKGYSEQGIASWYGREFHGRPTSSGEIYDMYALTAAHKTLPLPATARVTSLATGKSIIVRINDRGPFVKGRLIDLSYGAARELGFLNAGTTMVEVQTLAGPGDFGPAASDARASQAMYVQVGAFTSRQNAEQLRQRLQQQGFANAVIRYDEQVEPALFRVRIGPVMNATEYDAVAARVDRLNLGKPRLVVESSAADGAGPAPGGGMPGG